MTNELPIHKIKHASAFECGGNVSGTGSYGWPYVTCGDCRAIQAERQLAYTMSAPSLDARIIHEQRRRDRGDYDGGFGDANCPADY